VNVPETRYAKTADGVHIAYQVLGDGPGDLVFVPGFVFNVEQAWEWGPSTRFARRLASFSRLIQFDRRGTGLSDHIVPQDAQLTLEARMDDIRAVMDAVESDRAALYGFEEGFALCAMFAATYPDRVTALVAQAPSGIGQRDAERPWAFGEQTWDEYIDSVRNGWGTREFAVSEGRYVWPDIGDDADWFDHYATWMRRSVSPGDAVAFFKVESKLDVREVLPTVRTPTLVVQRVGDQALSIEYARFVAQQIPGAELVELNGANHGYTAPDQDEVLDEIERFITGLREEEAALDRVLATVLFTDIVDSTQTASTLGDHEWKALLERHHRTVRSYLARYRGREVDTAGDGFFATFDGPARGVRCAQQIVEAVRPLNLQIRAGVHTGEVEMISDKVSGLAVNIGARVGALAGPSEVLVSQTVKDLVVGSGITFADAGEHSLKGVPDRWHLYRVVE
jgi:class 3 adenylate cyclase